MSHKFSCCHRVWALLSSFQFNNLILFLSLESGLSRSSAGALVSFIPTVGSGLIPPNPQCVGEILFNSNSWFFLRSAAGEGRITKKLNLFSFLYKYAVAETLGGLCCVQGSVLVQHPCPESHCFQLKCVVVFL